MSGNTGGRGRGSIRQALVEVPAVGASARRRLRRCANAVLSSECVGWARAAGYSYSVEDEGAVLRCDTGPTRYFIRRRGPDRLELTVLSDGEAEQPVLFVSSVEVLERYLFGMFGDGIREDLGLSQLDLPWRREDLASGYALSDDMVRGYRTLSRTGVGPVAAVPDPTLSLLALVPLSHFLGYNLAALKQSFLSHDGAPLLRGSRYAP